MNKFILSSCFLYFSLCLCTQELFSQNQVHLNPADHQVHQWEMTGHNFSALEKPPVMDPANLITSYDKCFSEPGFPTQQEMGGKDVKIILPRDRPCKELWVIGGTDDNPAHNIWIIGGKIEYNGPREEFKTGAITIVNWSGTAFIEGIEIDVHNACLDGIRLSTAAINGEERRIVVQNSYIRGMGYCVQKGGTHGDLLHAQSQNDTRTWVKEMVAQNVRGDLINQGFFIPYRAHNSHGVLRAVFDHVDLHLDSRYKFEGNKISTMIFAGASGVNGDSPPPQGQIYNEVYLNWWDPWYPETQNRLNIVNPKPEYINEDGLAIYSDSVRKEAGITGTWRKGVPPGGSFVPVDKVGLNYDRSFFEAARIQQNEACKLPVK